MNKMLFIMVISVLMTACGANRQAEQVSAPSQIAALVPTETSTPAPTQTATLVPTRTSTATPAPTEVLSSRVFLSPMNNQWQTQNNCERASIAIALGYYDIWVDQHDVEYCVHELPAEISKYGLYGRIFRVGTGDPVTMDYVVRWLLSRDIPVIVGGVVSRSDSTRHYRVVQGYDDIAGIFFINDPLLGQFEMDYEEFNYIGRTAGYSVLGDIIPVYPRDLDQMIIDQMRSWGMYPN
jgi:endoglucanase Acf2